MKTIDFYSDYFEITDSDTGIKNSVSFPVTLSLDDDIVTVVFEGSPNLELDAADFTDYEDARELFKEIFKRATSRGYVTELNFRCALSQVGILDPEGVEFKNELGASVYTRDGEGSYSIAFPEGLIEFENIFIPGFGDWFGDANTHATLSDDGEAVGYYTIYPGPDDNVIIQFFDDAFAAADLSALAGITKVYIEFSVYL